MDDCASVVETAMQWMSESPTARVIDHELGTCDGELLGGVPVLSYLRYNTFLTATDVDKLALGIPAAQVATLGEMDDPANMDALLRIGEAVGREQVSAAHFTPTFDLPSVSPTSTHGRTRYQKRPNQHVVAVQLPLDGTGFTYEKWGGTQQCKPGDWLVNNNGEVYTVERESFRRTYARVGDGTYLKVAPVWASVAREDGRIATKEGLSAYKAGDYLVSNEEDGSDAYAVEAKKFEAMYEPVV
jgi:hypothetical protein